MRAGAHSLAKLTPQSEKHSTQPLFGQVELVAKLREHAGKHKVSGDGSFLALPLSPPAVPLAPGHGLLISPKARQPLPRHVAVGTAPCGLPWLSPIDAFAPLRLRCAFWVEMSCRG